MKTLKKIPTFKDEDSERKFWSKADSTEYIDWSKAQPIVAPNLRPTLRTISLRLQSLLKVFLADRLKQERSSTASSGKRASRKGRANSG